MAHVASLNDAEEQLRSGSLAPLVVLSDMTLPDGNALNLLEKLRTEGLGLRRVDPAHGIRDDPRFRARAAAGCLRVPGEALRDRAPGPGRRRRRPERARAPPAARAVRPRASALRAGGLRRDQRGHARGTRAAGAAVPGSLQRARDRRRDGHRQGAGGARPALQRCPRRCAAGGDQLRRAASGPARIRALRTRGRRIHRGKGTTPGAHRAGPGRHLAARRDWRDAARPAGEAAQGHRGPEHPTARRRAGDSRRGADRRVQQSRPGARGGGASLPGRPLPPAQRASPRPSGAA